ncbi:Exocyst complex component EXO70H1 [Linum grandiflorum]
MRSNFFKSPSPSPYHSPAASPPPRHTFSETLMEEDIDNAHSIISKYDSSDFNSTSSPPSSSSSLFSDDRIEAKKYLSAVKELQSAMQYYVASYPASEQLVRAQNLMQKAMKKLEREFYLILRSSRDRLDVQLLSSRAGSVSGSRARSSTASSGSDGESSDDAEEDNIPEAERASIVAITDLKSIADCMIAAGYTKECIKIYHIVRKSVVDEELYRLGIDRFSSSHIHKLDWEAVESKIKTWLYAVKAAVKTLFRGERLLCDHVFSSSSNSAIKEACFVEVVREGAMDLFGFPENVIKGKKKTLEKMFRTLDIYEAISDLWPEIESIFDFESTAAVRNLAVNSLVKLGDAVRMMLTDLETSITKDNSKTSVPGGGVHPLTRYVMNYISFLSDYTGALSDILADYPLEMTSPMPEAYFGSPGPDVDGVNVTSPVSVRLAWLILVLLCKLDGKVQFYNNVPLSYLFLANNLCYIVNKVRTSSIKFHLGEEWIEKHEAKVKQYAANYERLGWDKVMSSLPVNTTAGMTVEEAADCFRKFNSAFEEAYRKQSSWVVPDSRLRDDIKISLARNIGPAYRRFYEKYRTAVAREFGGVVRYAPDDLDNHWSDLFYGKVGGDGSVSTSYSSSARSSVSSRSSH